MSSRLIRAAQLSVLVPATLVAVAFARQSGPSLRRAAPTFSKDVAPVIYKNCASCHHPGGLGPFSLVDYDSAKAQTDKMEDAVSTGYMPPWHAEGPHGVFRNDRRLSDADKRIILDWIAGGAQRGDPKDLPPKPDFPSSWSIGAPDLVVSMPEDFVVPASGMIDYQYFTVPTNLTEDKWVQAIEIQPGAREVVHHVLVYAMVPPTPGAVPAPRPAGGPAAPLFIRNRQQAAIPDAPRTDTLHAPPRMGLGALIGTTAPGTNVVEFAPGTALRLRAGTVLTFQMHYTAHGHEMKDRSRVGFRFAAEKPQEEIFASQFVNGAFTIPAGQKDVAVPAEITAGQPVRIWGIFPHTHLRGTRWRYTLVKPDSTSEVILDMPHYDFNWQTYYLFDKPLDLAPGSKIMSTAWYDNSATNKHNPDATKDVHWGEQTWDEMQYTGFLYSVVGRHL
jgi:mono/diheme cytochrome c family protein